MQGEFVRRITILFMLYNNFLIILIVNHLIIHPLD
jgi:hypothetical protein